MKETIFHWLCTTHWGVSLSHLHIFGHISPSCVHIHQTGNKITLGKQKRMARSNLIPASNYSSIQSHKKRQETTKTEAFLSIEQYKEIFVSVSKDVYFLKLIPSHKNSSRQYVLLKIWLQQNMRHILRPHMFVCVCICVF